MKSIIRITAIVTTKKKMYPIIIDIIEIKTESTVTKAHLKINSKNTLES